MWLPALERVLHAAGLTPPSGEILVRVSENYPQQPGDWECGYFGLSALAHILFPTTLLPIDRASVVDALPLLARLDREEADVGNVEDLRALMYALGEAWITKMGLTEAVARASLSSSSTAAAAAAGRSDNDDDDDDEDDDDAVQIVDDDDPMT